MKTIDLNGTWQFKAIDWYKTLPNSHERVMRWMKGTVPGTVHTDLLANGIIPDPFYRVNELDVQWIDSQQWHYRKNFSVPERLLKESAVYLVAEGLDTAAQITLNGNVIGITANMFVCHEFEIRQYLRVGTNRIEILFDAPAVLSKKLEQRYGKLRVASESQRVYLRKAQYSFGWDWGPKLTTSGIWRNMSLQGFSSGRLKNPFVKVLSVSKREAVVEVSVDVEKFRDVPLSCKVSIAGERALLEFDSPANSSTVTKTVHIQSPKLWWPNGYGDQPLYSAVFALLDGDREVHHVETTFAIRTVKLRQEKDKEGTSFVIMINGVKVFCKGADWIPSDNFIPRIPDSTYESLLRMAKDAHMNMMRVWGGGIYEQDIFYRLCDELGLMVWQDFMYACGEYPEQPWFLKLVREEAEKVVRRLRNHPSIVLWCGNNECEWLYCTENPDKTPDQMNGARIFSKLLPAVCKELDGTRPYWRSSPFGTGFPNDETNGNHHQWIVWSYWKDYREYANDNARFVTEFGFQAPANRETFDEVTLLEDRLPQSPVMEHHNKQIEGTERLMRFQAAHYRIGDSYDDFIYKGQLVQAEALKFAIEHWRRRKFNTAGALFWQLNDCWPVSSWAVVDSALRPKAGYYFARKFFAPILVSFKETASGIEVWITNDNLKKLKGTLRVSLRSFGGRNTTFKRLDLLIAPNNSRLAGEIKSNRRSAFDRTTHYLHAELTVNREQVSENRYFFVEPKHMQLPEASLRTRLSGGKDGEYVLTVTAKSFVKNVRIEVSEGEYRLDDNYFDIDAGVTKWIGVRSSLPKRELLKAIRLRSL